MTLLTKYEIVNPADPYSISSSSEIHAAAAVILLTDGRFALRTRMDRVVCPTFYLTGERGIDIWWRTRPEFRTNPDFFVWAKSEYPGIADALETVQLEGQQTEGMDLVGMATTLAKALRNFQPQS